MRQSSGHLRTMTCLQRSANYFDTNVEPTTCASIRSTRAHRGVISNGIEAVRSEELNRLESGRIASNRIRAVSVVSSDAISSLDILRLPSSPLAHGRAFDVHEPRSTRARRAIIAPSIYPHRGVRRRFTQPAFFSFARAAATPPEGRRFRRVHGWARCATGLVPA